MKNKKANNGSHTNIWQPGAVGYCKPPKHCQFKKGTSGNPKGRPKGSQNLASVIKTTFQQKVTMTVDGKLKKVPLIEALLMKMMAQALTGHPAAMKMAIASYDSAHPVVNDNQPADRGSSFELSAEELAAIQKSSLLGSGE